GAVGVSGEPAAWLPPEDPIAPPGYALHCRVTTEDPARDFAPSHGRLTACQSPAGFGIRIDAGSAHTGAVVSSFYDSLLMKITAWGDSPGEAIGRMARALAASRVQGGSHHLACLARALARVRRACGPRAPRCSCSRPEAA